MVLSEYNKDLNFLFDFFLRRVLKKFDVSYLLMYAYDTILLSIERGRPQYGIELHFPKCVERCVTMCNAAEKTPPNCHSLGHFTRL